MFLSNPLEQIAKQKESALAVFVKAQQGLEKLIDFIEAVRSKKVQEIQALAEQVNERQIDIQKLEEESYAVEAQLAKVEEFLR